MDRMMIPRTSLCAIISEMRYYPDKSNKAVQREEVKAIHAISM